MCDKINFFSNLLLRRDLQVVDQLALYYTFCQILEIPLAKSVRNRIMSLEKSDARRVYTIFASIYKRKRDAAFIRNHRCEIILLLARFTKKYNLPIIKNRRSKTFLNLEPLWTRGV